MPHRIISVERDSPVYGRILPGDELVSIGGHPIIDVLDYEFYSYDADYALALRRGGRYHVLRVRKRAGERLGLRFESYLMDGERSCANRCVFCFIDQNPAGMRESIYYKDDDARLSFLTGNYVTLTNMGERELNRIAALRISPINVSVHATAPEVRREMLGNPRAGDVLEKMRRLADGGIKLNCQIVCCPGYNDGAVLEKTLADLAELFPAAASVSVVPVGLTAHRDSLTALVPVNKERAAEIIGIVDSFGEKFLKSHSARFAYCSDELYLKAVLDIPPEEYYEDFPQLENGVGMLRLFETEFIESLREAGDTRIKPPFSIVTGEAAAPFIKKLLRTAGICDNIESAVRGVQNLFFGPEVNVAGLVTGGDIARQLAGEQLGERLLIPRTMLRRGSVEFLDGMTVPELGEKLGVPIETVEMSGAALFDAIFMHS